MSESYMDAGYPQQYSVAPSQMQEGLLQYQLDANEIILDIQNSLLGKKQIFNPANNIMEWKKEPDSIQLINEKGMSALLVPLQSRLTKIFVLSDFDDEQIEKMTIEVGNNVVDTLYEHWEEYDVKSIAAASMITSLIVDAVYATLCKAKRHNYLTFLKTTQRIQEIQQLRGRENPSPPGVHSKAGIVDKIFSRR